MDSGTKHPAFASTRAITIPLHRSNATSSHRNGEQNTYRRTTKARRSSQIERTGSESDNTSSSSLGSDWTSSPVHSAQENEQSRLGLQVSVASPVSMINIGCMSDASPLVSQRKDKQRAASNEPPPNSLPPLFQPAQSPLGPSMLSSTAYKSINLNSHHDPDSKEPARLITYTKYSQGFTWNDELFLPSYLLGRHRYRGHSSGGARRRWREDDDDDDGMAEFDEEGERCPVTDIFVTDEEAAAMMP